MAAIAGTRPPGFLWHRPCARNVQPAAEGILAAGERAAGGPQLRVWLADAGNPPKLPVSNSNFVEGQLWPSDTGRSATLPANSCRSRLGNGCSEAAVVSDAKKRRLPSPSGSATIIDLLWLEETNSLKTAIPT